MLGLGGVIHVLDQFFVQNAKNDSRTLFERPKSDKLLKSGKCRNRRKQREKLPFSTFRTPKVGHFSRYLLEILYKYTPHRVLLRIFRFLENSK